MNSEIVANHGCIVRSYLKSLKKRESWFIQDDNIASEGASEMAHRQKVFEAMKPDDLSPVSNSYKLFWRSLHVPTHINT